MTLRISAGFDANCADGALRALNELCITAAAPTVHCVKWAKSGGQTPITNFLLFSEHLRAPVPFTSCGIFALRLPPVTPPWRCLMVSKPLVTPARQKLRAEGRFLSTPIPLNMHNTHTHTQLIIRSTHESRHTCKDTQTHTLAPTFIEQESNYLTQIQVPHPRCSSTLTSLR